MGRAFSWRGPLGAIAVVALALGLAACGGEATPTAPAAPTATLVPTVTPTPVPTPTPAGPVGSQAVTLLPSQDATIWGAAGSTASGAGPNLFVGTNNQGQPRRALLRFDIAGQLPAGATVVSVALEISTNKSSSAVTGEEFALHRVLASWGEGSSDAGDKGSGTKAATGDVTWIWREFETLAWGAEHPGGDFADAASAMTTSGAWASSTALVGDVQRWLDDATSNHGWIVMGGEESNQTVRRVDSREGADPPTLTITYDPVS
jgi:hypothetical protein